MRTPESLMTSRVLETDPGSSCTGMPTPGMCWEMLGGVWHGCGLTWRKPRAGRPCGTWRRSSPTTTRPNAHAALRAYATETGAAVPEPEALAPFRRARDLEGAVWLVCMADVYPERYAAPAREQMAVVLGAG